MTDLRKCRRYVLARNGKYLTRNPLWTTNSAYSAELYKDKREAMEKAKLYRAKILAFNPVTGEVTHG